MRGTRSILPRLKTAFAVTAISIVSACASYYQSSQSFNQEFETGDLEGALNSLRSNSAQKKPTREFLYQVNNGLVLSMLGRYEESNEFLEQAYLYGEDYRKNYLREAGSYLTNPTFTSYKGEDHEHLMLLYYKALNYMKMGMHEEALVECRRLNIRLQQLSDRYEDDRKYREDAFIHLLMGIIYDADRDYNNAFIAYRNAWNIYAGSFQDLFGLHAPEQLKRDMLRTARLSGLSEEYESWRETFGIEEEREETDEAALVFLWHNGLAPIKTEWGVNFVISRKGNWVHFSNPDLSLDFPFNMEQYDEKDKQGVADLEVFRVAFPRYAERPVYYRSASISINGDLMALEKIEDINRIAFKCLDQRMKEEFAKALLRVALKKVAEYEVRKRDKALGAVLGVMNALTERADTRNWQTLPYEIYYSRVPLKPGRNKLNLVLASPGKQDMTYDFEYDAKPGEVLFHTFTSLESRFPSFAYY
jgi:hypothetical protein